MSDFVFFYFNPANLLLFFYPLLMVIIPSQVSHWMHNTLLFMHHCLQKTEHSAEKLWFCLKEHHIGDAFFVIYPFEFVSVSTKK